MSRSFRLMTSSLGVMVLLAVAVAAQQPRIANGRVVPQAAGAPFVQSFRSLVSAQPDVAWIGYSVPISDGERVMCCFGSGNTWINGNVVSSNGSCSVTAGTRPATQWSSRSSSWGQLCPPGAPT